MLVGRRFIEHIESLRCASVLRCAHGVAVLLISTSVPLASGQELEWAIRAGGVDSEAFDVATDDDGNAYVTGSFVGTATFGEGGFNETVLVSAGATDIFLAKYDRTGDLVWATRAGGTLHLPGHNTDEGVAIAVDRLGRSFVTGYYTAAATFGVGEPMETTLEGVAWANIFVAGYDDGGALMWAKSIEPSAGSLNWGLDIAVDTSGDAYVTGRFSGDLTFDKGDDNETVLAANSSGGYMFVAKYASSGALAWAARAGWMDAEGDAAGHAEGLAIAVAGDHCYVTGGFVGKVTFGAGESNETVLTAERALDAFVAKYQSDGTLAWVSQTGGDGIVDEGRGIAVDVAGHIYIVGSFSETVRVSLGKTDEIALAAAGTRDVFVAKYDQGGALLWAKSTGGVGVTAELEAIATDRAGQSYVFGAVSGGGATFTSRRFQRVFPSEGNTQFLGSFDKDGEWSWVTGTLGVNSRGYGFGPGIAADTGDGIYIAGSFRNTITLGAGESNETVLSSAGDRNIVVARFRSSDVAFPQWWKAQFGLDPFSATGDDGPDGDPDGDGKTNRDEFEDGTHPRGFFTRYLAEGATGTFFDTRLALANPTDTPALVLLRYQKSSGETVPQFLTLAPFSRATVDVASVGGLDAAEFSTVVESDVEIVVDRTMTWDARGYGAHAERGISTAAATTWYFAEGATHSGFALFYLIQNPSDQPAAVEVTYLRPAPAPPLVKTYTVGPQTRFNIWVNNEAQTDPHLAPLAATDLSAVITSVGGVPIIAERAMYLHAAGVPFGAGHESAGVTAPSTSWFLAEGATGDFFDMFVLIANPTDDDAIVQASFLLPSGEIIVKQHQVAARSRFNIWVDAEDPRLADTAVSTTITSLNDVPIVVERAMWWPGQPSAAAWHEAHNSPGSTTTGTRWAVAEGETGGPRGVETYLLIANTSSFHASVRVTLLFEDATTAVQTFDVLPNSRFNVAPAAMFPESAGRRYGALIESVGETPAEIVVERAMYWDALGLRWAAGTNALGTRLP